MLFATGAIGVQDERALVERASLLAPELGMDSPYLDQFQVALSEDLGAERTGHWLSAAASPLALTLIKRFSAGEGDSSDNGLKGLGRMSSKSFPRLGGVLHQEVQKAGVERADIVHAVERTIQASYLAMLISSESILDRRRLTDENDVWERWIPNAYVVPEQLFARIGEVCAFVEFWKQVLEGWGLKKAAKQLKRPRTAVNSSVGGLAGVGAALAIAEREAG